MHTFSIIYELGVIQEHAKAIYEDNAASIEMANAHNITTQTRHMAIQKY